MSLGSWLSRILGLSNRRTSTKVIKECPMCYPHPVHAPESCKAGKGDCGCWLGRSVGCK